METKVDCVKINRNMIKIKEVLFNTEVYMSSHPIYRIESFDLFSEKTGTNQIQDNLVDINSYEYINDIYKNIFKMRPVENLSEDISEKDCKIIRSFTNTKSFENAVEVCLKLLEPYNNDFLNDEKNKNDKSCVTMDSKIICDCMDILAACRVPSHYKPGYLIIMVKHMFMKKKSLC